MYSVYILFASGTRYRRRGIDEDGHCANFVETEQILQTGGHSISYLQVRGSIPVFWSQPGIKYRPPPRIDRGEVLKSPRRHCERDKNLRENNGQGTPYPKIKHFQKDTTKKAAEANQ